jgi:hypothetical protein
MREQQAQKSCNEIENKNRHFDSNVVILPWQTMGQELLFHRHRLHRSSACIAIAAVRPVRQFLPRSVHPDRLSQPTV